MGNLYKRKLKGKNVGIFFGTFAPLHIGHIDTILKAKKENDGVIVIVSGYQSDRGEEVGLDLQRRFRYLRETFADDEMVYVEKLDESNIAKMPDGWEEWFRILKSIIYQIIPKDTILTYYTGEKEYIKELKQRDPEAKFKLQDRSLINISGTKIRKNPLKYWKYIGKVFRRAFSTNIVFSGGSSIGKTTLVKDIAKILNCPYVPEYSRNYQEESNVRDEELGYKDYKNLVKGQYKTMSLKINSEENTGIVLEDTDAIVTLAYSIFWQTKQESKELRKEVEEILRYSKIDLIILIPPMGKYVDDNFRDTTLSDEMQRWEFYGLLKKLYKEYGLLDKVVELSPEVNEEDPYGYYQRYIETLRVIKNRLDLDYI